MGQKQSADNLWSTPYRDDEALPNNFRKELEELNLNEYLDFSLESEQKIVEVSSLAEQQIEVLCTLRPKKEIKVLGSDVVALLDISRSMRGEKFNLAKKSIVSLIQLLKENDRFSLVTFNNLGQRCTNFMRMNQKGKAKALEALNKIELSGTTNLYHGTLKAIQAIHSRQHVQNTPCLMLFSDGANRVSHTSVRNNLQAQLGMEHNYKFFIYKLDDHCDDDYLEKIAKDRNGSKIFALSSMDEKNTINLFNEALNSLDITVAMNAQITLRPDDSYGHVEIVSCTKHEDGQTTYHKSGNSATVNITEVNNSKPIKFGLKLKLPKNEGIINQNERTKRVLSALTNVQDLGGEEYIMKRDLKLDFYDLDNQDADTPPIVKSENVALSLLEIQVENALRLHKNSPKAHNTTQALNTALERLEASDLKQNEKIQSMIRDVSKALGKRVKPANNNKKGLEQEIIQIDVNDKNNSNEILLE